MRRAAAGLFARRSQPVLAMRARPGWRALRPWRDRSLRMLSRARRRGPYDRTPCRRSTCAWRAHRPAHARLTTTWPGAPCPARSPMLDGKKAAGAAKTALNLVGDEQRAVLAAEFESPGEIIVVRKDDALALDGFDDETGDLPRPEDTFQCRDIVERHFDAFRQKRPKTGAENTVPVQRERAIRQAMKRVRAIDDPRAAGCSPRKFQCGLDRFSAGI